MAGDKLRVIGELDCDAGMVVAFVGAWRSVSDVMRCASSIDDGDGISGCSILGRSCCGIGGTLLERRRVIGNIIRRGEGKV